ncbi:UDP-N-acetylmuramate dehydrogenase [Myxococcota bacterium]|nr:UDP-N-acetylmuramate dehydrogenase [Myxococcota bacterium]
MPRLPDCPGLTFAADVPLAPRTTFGLGGPAKLLASATTPEAVRCAVTYAAENGRPLFVLGGGSNLLVADRGFDGVVLVPSLRGLSMAPDGRLTVAAGEPWEAVVEAAVAAGRAGVECLTGIPGTAGAAPVQNIGAYGQEVADTLESVEVLDRATGRIERLERAACGFGYRDSRFKRAPEQAIVLGLTLALRGGDEPEIRYEELRRALATAPNDAPPLARIRRAVRGVRAGKGMLLAPEAPPDARRTAGSFFMNPRLTAEEAAALPADAPRHVDDDGRVKVPAAWLIEHAGVTRGWRLGAAGVSPHHALALVAHEGATAHDVLRVAAHVRAAVRAAFGVTLSPEPVFVGFDLPPDVVLGVFTTIDPARKKVPVPGSVPAKRTPGPRHKE